jgi:chromosome transmission fidelity protein 4
VLDVRVFNISEKAQSLSGRLLLTPSSQLSWFGFSDNGQLSSYDSKVWPSIMLVLNIGLVIPMFKNVLMSDNISREY